VFQAEDGIRDFHVTGVQTCALPIYTARITVWRGERQAVLTGSSLGAGRILVTGIDGFPVEVTGAYTTLVLVAHDQPGIVAHVAKIGRASCREAYRSRNADYHEKKKP